MKSGVLRVRYYFGYPGRVLREMAAGLLGGGGILVAALLLSLLPVLNFIDIWQRQGDYPALGTWVAGITGVALFALFSCIAVTSLIANSTALDDHVTMGTATLGLPLISKNLYDAYSREYFWWG